MLSDLRESGSIEQDADAVIFVFREEYYLKGAEPDTTSPDYAEWSEKMDRARNIAELIVAKNRHGPTKTAKVFFDPATNRTGDLAQEQGGEFR